MTLPEALSAHYSGPLCFIDLPSDRPLRGAKGHRCILHRKLLVNYQDLEGRPVFRDHTEEVLGTVEEVRVLGRMLVGRLRLDADHGPEVKLSIDLAKSSVEDTTATLWVILKAEWKGVSVVTTAQGFEFARARRLA